MQSTNTYSGEQHNENISIYNSPENLLQKSTTNCYAQKCKKRQIGTYVDL